MFFLRSCLRFKGQQIQPSLLYLTRIFWHRGLVGLSTKFVYCTVQGINCEHMAIGEIKHLRNRDKNHICVFSQCVKMSKETRNIVMDLNHRSQVFRFQIMQRMHFSNTWGVADDAYLINSFTAMPGGNSALKSLISQQTRRSWSQTITLSYTML